MGETRCDPKESEPKKSKRQLTLPQLGFGGLIAVIGLGGSGVATYTKLQTDIATLQRGETYRAETNKRQDEELIRIRDESRETMKEFNQKLDRIIEQWPRGRK